MIFLKRYSSRIIAVFAGLFAIIGTGLYLSLPYGFFSINWTTSLPGTFLWVDKTAKPKLGDIAAFYPPKGHKLHQDLWFGKVIVGQAGDEVQIENNRVSINGRDFGEVKHRTLHGAPLEPANSGVIPDEHVFMWTPHERSYDSRYKDIGLIHEDAIFGRLVRLL